MATQGYTILGSLIWEWEPFISLDPISRCFWLGLYTSAEGVRLPGLFVGSVHGMSEAAKLRVDDALKALDTLLERDLVEFDQKHRVLRFCELPDGLCSPPNGNVIRGWWKRFKSTPDCAVRNAHVRTIGWMMNWWSADSGKPISNAHVEAWNETFGTVAVPPPRRRGVRRLAESATGTPAQPGLFDPPTPSPAADPDESASTANSSTSVVGPTSDVRPALTPPSQTIESPIRETVSKPFPNGSGNGPDQDPDRDLDLDLRSQRSGAQARLPGDRDREDWPRLTLVPMPTPEKPPETIPPTAPPTTETSALASMTPEELVQRLSQHTTYKPVLIRDDAAQNALRATIADLARAGWGDAEIDAVAHAIAHKRVGDPQTERWFQLADWATDPSNVMAALADAHAQERKSAKASAELAEITKQLGYTT